MAALPPQRRSRFITICLVNQSQSSRLSADPLVTDSLQITIGVCLVNQMVGWLPVSGNQLILELPVTDQLIQRMRPMFNVGEKNVPENSDKVHIKHPGDDFNQCSFQCFFHCCFFPVVFCVFFSLLFLLLFYLLLLLLLYLLFLLLFSLFFP